MPYRLLNRYQAGPCVCMSRLNVIEKINNGIELLAQACQKQEWKVLCNANSGNYLHAFYL